MNTMVRERATPRGSAAATWDMGTPGRSPAMCGRQSVATAISPMPIARSNRSMVALSPGDRWVMRRWGGRHVTEFSTPQRETTMGVEFRTPQHPLTGSNNWGGPSPLLSRHIPKESMDSTDYLRFSGIMLDDEEGRGKAVAGEGTRQRRGGWLSAMLRWRGKEKDVKKLGFERRKRGWLPDGDHRNRWPQGWS